MMSNRGRIALVLLMAALVLLTVACQVPLR